MCKERKQEVTYFASILSIMEVTPDRFVDTNNELYNTLLSEHMGRFEADNRVLFQDIDNFDKCP